MLKINIGSEDRSKVKSGIENNDFLKHLDVVETDVGFELSGMLYVPIEFCGIGCFFIFGENSWLDEVVAEAFKKVPEVELEGSLLLGDDKYRQYYWFSSEAGNETVTVDFAINIDDFVTGLNDKYLGAPLSSAWCYILYDTNYGTEYVYFKSVNDLRASVNCAMSDCNLNFDDKKLGLNLMEIYKFVSTVMGQSAADIKDLKEACNEIKKKYSKEDVEEDGVSQIILNHLVPMASAISGKSVDEIWVNAVKKKLSKSKFFKLFKIEEDLEDLENEDYVELLGRIADEYGGFSELSFDDVTDLCDKYGISTEIDEEKFEEAIEKIENMGIPQLDEDWM